MPRRVHPRVETTQRCWCEADAVTLFAQMGNLSEGGAFVKTYAPLAEGTRARVRFALEDGPVIEAGVRVVWRRTSSLGKHEPGMGLEFVDIDPGQRAALRAFVQERGGTA